MTRPIAERLRDRDPGERRAACRAAAEDASAVLWVDALVATLGDPERGVARAASDALADLGRRDREVKARLRSALHATDPDAARAARLHWGAAWTLARLAPPHPGLLPAVVEALASPDGDVRWAAARLLVDTGRLHGEVLGVALGLARTGASPVVRRMAAFCLRELAPDRPEAAAVLLEATRDPDLRVRRAAFTALAGLLDPPSAVVERLREAVRGDPDPTLRGLAAVALGELGAQHPGAVPAEGRGELERLRDGAREDGLRRAAERALDRLGAGRSGGRSAT